MKKLDDANSLIAFQDELNQLSSIQIASLAKTNLTFKEQCQSNQLEAYWRSRAASLYREKNMVVFLPTDQYPAFDQFLGYLFYNIAVNGQKNNNPFWRESLNHSISRAFLPAAFLEFHLLKSDFASTPTASFNKQSLEELTKKILNSILAVNFSTPSFILLAELFHLLSQHSIHLEDEAAATAYLSSTLACLKTAAILMTDPLSDMAISNVTFNQKQLLTLSEFANTDVAINRVETTLESRGLILDSFFETTLQTQINQLLSQRKKKEAASDLCFSSTEKPGPSTSA